MFTLNFLINIRRHFVKGGNILLNQWRQTHCTVKWNAFKHISKLKDTVECDDGVVPAERTLKWLISIFSCISLHSSRWIFIHHIIQLQEAPRISIIFEIVCRFVEREKKKFEVMCATLCASRVLINSINTLNWNHYAIWHDQVIV